VSTAQESVPESPPLSEAADAEPEIEPAAAEPEAEEPADPVSYAQIQADQILRDAERRAKEILEQAQREAQEQSAAILEASRQEGMEAGRAEGVALGVQQALEEGRQERERQAQALGAETAQFLEQAGRALDRQLDDNVEELRDLALAIAEKVVSVSLKSSSEVICRMIQAAIDKRKRREWVHIYIAECDAKQLVKIPQSLSSALSALSGRVRIIPMADDEAGTCIIEMPDEIIDASAATQLNNIRSLLSDTPTGEMGGNLNLGGGIFEHVPADDPSGL
jgi:flagellar assembly protein FliH